MLWYENLQDFVEWGLSSAVEVGADFDDALDSVPADRVWTLWSLLDVGLLEVRESYRSGDGQPSPTSDETRSNVNLWRIANDKRDRAREWRDQVVANRLVPDAQR